MHGEKLKGYNILTNQDTLRNLNSSGVGIALIGTAVVIVGAAIFVACAPAAVAGSAATAIAAEGSGQVTIVYVAQQAAELILEYIGTRA